MERSISALLDALPGRHPQQPTQAESSCKACGNFAHRVSKDEEDKRFYWITAKYAELDPKCNFCALIRSIIHHIAQCRPGHPISAWLMRIRPWHGRAWYLNLGTHSPVEGRGPVEILLSLYLERKCPLLPSIGTFKPYSTELELEHTVEFLRREMNECVNSHAHCTVEKVAPLPTRLLSIGTAEGDAIKLVETRGMTAAYATLSHCWGDLTSQPLRTTPSNFPGMLVSIPPKSLPVVFSQAILVARKLGIAYIWIDSLCIIQGNKEDWELESSRMCDYYQNGVLNIATAASPSHDVAFLKDRPDRFHPAKFELIGHKETYEVCVRQIPNLDDKAGWGRLCTRGWTFQEAALSVRTVYFTESDTVWECRSNLTSENATPGLPRYDSSFCLSRYTDLLRRCPDVTWLPNKTDLGVPKVAHYMWNELIGGYSKRHLTITEDKLPALSGLAALAQAKFGSRYLAGLWESTLPFGLAWEASERPLACAPSQYLGPSWSWTSVTDPVQYVFDPQVEDLWPAAQVVDVRCEVPGQNPYGRVETGVLTLRGKVAKFRISSKSRFYFDLAYLNGPLEKWDASPDCALADLDGEVRRATPSSQCRQRDVTAELLGIYLGVARPKGLGRPDGGIALTHFVLLLGKLPGQADEYQRVALATCRETSLPDKEVEQQIRII